MIVFLFWESKSNKIHVKAHPLGCVLLCILFTPQKSGRKENRMENLILKDQSKLEIEEGYTSARLVTYVDGYADLQGLAEKLTKNNLSAIQRVSQTTEELLEILSFARENFPSLGRISSYGTPGDILRKTKEELTRLRKAGLELIYMGAESGCQQVLRSVNKGASRDEIIAAGKKLKACGMEASVTLISGLGGRKLLKEHAVDSASLISEINPRYVGFLTLMLDEDAPIMEQIKRKELELLEPQEVLEEMRLFLQHVHSEGTIFRSNHASNYIALKGTLDGDIPRMLAQLEEIEKEQRFRPERFRAL